VNFEDQLIFFFSALGAFNGFLLSLYFAATAKKKNFSNYFLALLLLMLSIRILKSVFFYFNPQLANIFIQIGLSALTLIGPFLYLYLKSHSQKREFNWIFHIIPITIGITLLGIYYPYVENRVVWATQIVRWINYFWLVYIILSFRYVLPSLQKIAKKQKMLSIDIWLISVYIGVVIVWCGYTFGTYTSYIVGALSFTFVLYLIILLIIFKSNSKTTFFKEKKKYQNKDIEDGLVQKIEIGLSKIIEKELFLNPNISLTRMAKEINVPKHILSQYLNEKLGKSFTMFINELRIEKAKELLHTKSNFTIEGIGYESGFKSKSTFFTTFKKITGQTPSEYKKKSRL